MAKKSSSKIVREAAPVTPGMMRSTKAMREEEARWRAESDLRSLTEAGEIQRDKKRLSAAKALAKEKIDCMKDVTGK